MEKNLFQLFLRKLNGNIRPLEVSGNFKSLYKLNDEQTLESVGINTGNFTLHLILKIGSGYSKTSLDFCVDYKDLGKSEHDYIFQ